MKKLIRPFGVFLCVLATKVLIFKHKPIIYIITGSGETSLVRETLYTSLKENLAVRRNLEKPEAEFSIPLTIFGEFHYPNNFYGWIKIYTLTLLRLIYLKPYKHTLILEINSINQQILDKWLPILTPSKIFVIGNLENLPKKYNDLIYKIYYHNDLFKDISESIATFVSKEFNMEKSEILNKLNSDSFPNSRINFAKSKLGNIVIDATYFQFAPQIKSVEEIIEIFPGPKKIIGEIPESWKENSYISKIPKIDDFEQSEKEDIILLVGNRTNVLSLRRDLFI